VRGNDQRAGPDGSPEQEALRAELRAEGLAEPKIDFWCTHDLSVQAVLGYMASRGVQVNVLIWSSSEVFSHCDPKAAQEQLTQVGVSCILDDSAYGLLHRPIESLHQKTAIVDGTHAFVGGIDMLIELSGDYDRWDTHFHHYSSPLRSNEEERTPHNWHDAHAILEGPAVADVERNFRQRWNEVVGRHGWDSHLLLPEHPLPAPLESTSLVQVARRIPMYTYEFGSENGITGIAQLYANALGNAHHFVYLENQYFWLHAFLGIDRANLGIDSPDMERNLAPASGSLAAWRNRRYGAT
jgi:phosphatidylserine/phosphatidylglycerophosphate/cardiolipin synthase-like enzyme